MIGLLRDQGMYSEYIQELDQYDQINPDAINSFLASKAYRSLNQLIEMAQYAALSYQRWLANSPDSNEVLIYNIHQEAINQRSKYIRNPFPSYEPTIIIEKVIRAPDFRPQSSGFWKTQVRAYSSIFSFLQLLTSECLGS